MKDTIITILQMFVLVFFGTLVCGLGFKMAMIVVDNIMRIFA